MTWRPLLVLPLITLALSGCLLSRGDGLTPRLIEPAALPPVPTQPIANAVSVRLAVVDAAAPILTEVLHHEQTGEVRRDPQWRWSEPPAELWQRALRGSATAHGVNLTTQADIATLSITLVRFGLVHDDTTTQMSLVAEARLTRADRQVQVFTITRSAPVTQALPGDLPQAVAQVLAQGAAACWQEVRQRTAP